MYICVSPVTKTEVVLCIFSLANKHQRLVIKCLSMYDLINYYYQNEYVCKPCDWRRAFDRRYWQARVSVYAAICINRFSTSFSLFSSIMAITMYRFHRAKSLASSRELYDEGRTTSATID